MSDDEAAGAGPAPRISDPELRGELNRFLRQAGVKPAAAPRVAAEGPPLAAPRPRVPAALYGGVKPEWIREAEAVASGEKKRQQGRPPRHHELPWPEIEHLFIFGEPYQGQDGETYLRHPTTADLARRFNCDPKTVRTRANREKWEERRERVEKKIEEAVEDAIVVQHAEVRIDAAKAAEEAIDGLLAQFAGAVAEGKIRVDSVRDFERLVRLRSFVGGGPDSRGESSIAIGLDDLAERFERSAARRAQGLNRLGEAGAKGEPVVLPITLAAERKKRGASGE